jgi:hypothetical protein
MKKMASRTTSRSKCKRETLRQLRINTVQPPSFRGTPCERSADGLSGRGLDGGAGATDTT